MPRIVHAPAAPSLRSSFAWSFAGNVVNGFSQWAILALIARLGSVGVLGQYALAVAAAAPISMLAHMNLRTVLATDVDAEHPLADYLSVRTWVALAGFSITLATGIFWKPFWPVGLTIIVVGATFALENYQDLLYGVMQRRERLDLVAKSMALRGLLGIACAAAMLVASESAVSAAGGILVSRLLILLLFDARQKREPAGSRSEPMAVFRKALPLGITLMLVSLTANIPRYAVEHWLGSESLGTFVAVVSFITVGSVMMNALGQSATTRLARAFRSGDTVRFWSLTLRLCALAAAIGLGGASIAFVAGDYCLRLVYRPELAAYQPLLVRALLAGTLGYVAAILGFVVSSTRRFTQQIPLLLLVALTSSVVAVVLVPESGLSGAVVAIGAAGVVQILGNLWILRKAA